MDFWSQVKKEQDAIVAAEREAQKAVEAERPAEAVKEAETERRKETAAEDGAAGEGGEGEQVRPERGRKQLEKAVRDIKSAKDLKEKTTALYTFKLNERRGAVPTAEEKAFIAEVESSLEKEGYEVVDQTGLDYNEGLRCEADFVVDESLQPGEKKISVVKRPLVLKDGQMVQKPYYIVAQSPYEAEGAQGDVAQEIVNNAIGRVLDVEGQEVRSISYDGAGERKENQSIENISNDERIIMENRISEWLSEENLSRAYGKTREEIFKEFGNDLEPIAYIPNRYAALIHPNIKDTRIYCGKGYFIDHALRNHANTGSQTDIEDIDVGKYLNIQHVLDNPDHIKETFIDGKRTVVFIKKIGRYFAELTQTEENGKIVLHKSFYNQKKEPYAKLADIRFIKPSSEGGISSISHAEQSSAPAISLESRDDKLSSFDKKNKATGNKQETSAKDGENSVAAAEAEVNTEPTEAQKAAGNYKMGHVKIDGYDVTIENPKGSVRSKKDANGNVEWSVTMNNTYGYIRGTEGVDGDHIDVFLSDHPEEGEVFVVDQLKEDGSFDEHKVMYGFASELDAEIAYLANYSPDWKGLGKVTRVSKEDFKKWIDSSHRKTKPFAEYAIAKRREDQVAAAKKIVDDVLSGDDFRERIELADATMEHNRDALEQLEAREGKPFEDQEALDKALEKLDEYEDLMRKELEEKEAKYAEMDKEVEGAKGIEAIDNDDENSYREVVSVNDEFNETLESLTEKNADSIVLNLGKPSDILLSAGVSNKPMKLYGNKVIKKQKKHGFDIPELKDLPLAVYDPIAVFDNLGRAGNRSILTELKTEQGNFLVTLDIGKDQDVDFNIISSVFGKGTDNLVYWFNRGYAT